MKEANAIRLFAVLAVSIALPWTPVLAAAPGDLDTGFGTGGKVTTPIGTGADQAYGLVMQSDGKILVVGTSVAGSNYDFALARYDSDGTLDTSFGSGGKTTTPIGGGNDYAQSVALQPDGKIVVAGFSFIGGKNVFALVRYNSDGSLDTSFDTDGKVTTVLGGISDVAYGVAMQSDGKIVLAGYCYNGSKNNFALARYNSDGSQDTSFDEDGELSTAIGSFNDVAFNVVVQGDGKILAVGGSGNGSNEDFALARYDSNGTLDATFNGGTVTTAIGSSDERAYAVTTQSDGKIVVAGYSSNGTNKDFALVRYNPNGSLDTSFGSGGKVTTPMGSSEDYGRGMALQCDGKIVVAGYAFNGSKNDFALARYFGTTEPEIAVEQPVGTNLTDNAAQINFGRVKVGATPAVRTFTIRNVSTAVLTDLAVTTDGANADEFTVGALGATTLAAGTSTTFDVTFAPGAFGTRAAAIHIASNDADENPFDIALAGTCSAPPTIATYRVLPCGTVGSLYSLALEATDAAPFTWSVIAGSLPGPLDLTSDGTLSGTPTAAGVTSFTVRVTDNDGLSTTKAFDLKIMGPSESGALDVAFGTGGKVITPIGSSQDHGSGVVLQSDDKIVVAGSSLNSDGNYDFAAVRYNSNGSLDTSFDTDGKVSTAFGSGDDCAMSTTVQSDGKLVLAGYSTDDQMHVFALARYNSDGSLDTTFDADGKVTTDIGVFGDAAYSVAIQSDGKIVVAGNSAERGRWPSSTLALARYHSDGSLDTSFDVDGRALGFGSCANGIVIQSDGKILVAGYSAGMGPYNSYYVDFSLERLNANGSVDTSFGGDGWVITPVGSASSAVAVALQSDGKIVVAGNSYNGHDQDFALVRYNSDGSLDTSFGSGGKVTTPVGDSNDNASSVVVLPNGKILVAGTAANGITSDDVALVLYQSNGSLDTSFGYGGILTTHVGTRGDQAMSLAVQSDGKIVVAGYTSNGGNDDFMVVRFVAIQEPEIVVEQPEGTNLTDGSGTVDWGYAEISAVGSGRMFTVRNTGPGNLTGLEVTIDGANKDDFAAGSPAVTTLAPGASTTFVVNFFPSVAGYRTATVHVASNDADENPFDIAVAGTGLSHLEIWRLINFGSYLNAGDGANLYDFDHDGFANLLEYALGGNPKSPDAAAMCPTSGFEGGKFSISFVCDTIRTDITYTVQASPTLAVDSWIDIARSVGGVTVTPIGSLSEVTDSGTGLRTATVTASPSVFPTGRGFLRIRISE